VRLAVVASLGAHGLAVLALVAMAGRRPPAIDRVAVAVEVSGPARSTAAAPAARVESHPDRSPSAAGVGGPIARGSDNARARTAAPAAPPRVAAGAAPPPAGTAGTPAPATSAGTTTSPAADTPSAESHPDRSPSAAGVGGPIARGSDETVAPDADAIHAAVAAAVHYPRLARGQGAEGRVVVRFRIDDAGVPQELAIVTSAGAILDAAARAAVERAAPFRSPPGWVRVPVEFTLHDGR
jgi:protein TonB